MLSNALQLKQHEKNEENIFNTTKAACMYYSSTVFGQIGKSITYVYMLEFHLVAVWWAFSATVHLILQNLYTWPHANMMKCREWGTKRCLFPAYRNPLAYDIMTEVGQTGLLSLSLL